VSDREEEVIQKEKAWLGRRYAQSKGRRPSQGSMIS
jgi:hypothetical protein